MFCTLFGSSYCFLVNDIFDRKKDLLNQKYRPIATGVIPVNVAIGISAILISAFLVSAFHLGQTVFGLSFLFLFLASTYSLVNLKTGLLANVVVAFIVSGTQWGVMFVRYDPILWGSATFLFLFSIPREILLDLLDAEGDGLAGKRSVPLNHKKYLKLWILILLGAFSLTGLVVPLMAEISAVPLGVFSLAILSGWWSFYPFLREESRSAALRSVRYTHVTFGLLILALILR